MIGFLFPCLAYTLCWMDMSLFFLPPFSLCLSPSPSPNQASYHYTYLHSYHLSFYFYGPHPIPISFFVAQRRRNKVKNTRQVCACANRNQLTRDKQSNAFIWKETIRDYVKNGFWHKALRMYYQMQRAGIDADRLVFISVIKACGSLSDLQAGMKIHEEIMARGFESDVFVGNALVSMYDKCEDLENAREVSERMPEQDVVSWNAIIAGYSQNGRPQALAFISEMQVQGIKASPIIMVSVLHACAHLLALEQGKQIHGYAIRSGFESVVARIGLVDMYAKCGNVNIAHKLFERMLELDVVSYNAMILAYRIHGHGEDALTLFSQMQQTTTKLVHSTFTAILTTCSHAGLVNQGWQHFESMKSDYGFEPKLENYALRMFG